MDCDPSLLQHHCVQIRWPLCFCSRIFLVTPKGFSIKLALSSLPASSSVPLCPFESGELFPHHATKLCQACLFLLPSMLVLMSQQSPPISTSSCCRELIFPSCWFLPNLSAAVLMIIVHISRSFWSAPPLATALRARSTSLSNGHHFLFLCWHQAILFSDALNACPGQYVLVRGGTGHCGVTAPPSHQGLVLRVAPPASMSGISSWPGGSSGHASSWRACRKYKLHIQTFLFCLHSHWYVY